MVIEIDMDTRPFGDPTEVPGRATILRRGEEVGRILRKLSDRTADYGLAGRSNGFLLDADGQRVGSWSVTP